MWPTILVGSLVALVFAAIIGSAEETASADEAPAAEAVPDAP